MTRRTALAVFVAAAGEILIAGNAPAAPLVTRPATEPTAPPADDGRSLNLARTFLTVAGAVANDLILSGDIAGNKMLEVNAVEVALQGELVKWKGSSGTPLGRECRANFYFKLQTLLSLISFGSRVSADRAVAVPGT